MAIPKDETSVESAGEQPTSNQTLSKTEGNGTYFVYADEQLSRMLIGATRLHNKKKRENGDRPREEWIRMESWQPDQPNKISLSTFALGQLAGLCLEYRDDTDDDVTALIESGTQDITSVKRVPNETWFKMIDRYQLRALATEFATDILVETSPPLDDQFAKELSKPFQPVSGADERT